MAEYIIPNVPLECLEEILKILIRTNDPEATFISPQGPAPSEPESNILGNK